jgi:ATP-dependent Lon protease
MSKKPKTDDIGDLTKLITERLNYIREIIRNTSTSTHYYKKMIIFSNVDLNACQTALNDLYSSTTELEKTMKSEPIETSISSLQKIIDRLSVIMSGYGTKNIDDLIYITIGSEFKKSINKPEIMSKYELIKNYIHPVGFKLISDAPKAISSSAICIDKITDDSIKIETAPILECFLCDVDTTSVLYKINGIQVVIRDTGNKLIIINGIVDDINLDLFSNEYVNRRLTQINEIKPDANQEVFTRHIEQLTLRDILIFGNQDIIKKYYGVLSSVNSIKTENIDQIVKKFAKLDMISRRSMLIDLLTYSVDSEIQYIAYMLYDLTVVDDSDSSDQISMFDSFHWKTKLLFKDTMKHTIKHTQFLSAKYDVNKITLEQRIHLLRVPDNVKEKAMNKLKEVKNKSDESGSKAKQYLEGLIKIPFNIFKEEPILKITKRLNITFFKNLKTIRNEFPDISVTEKGAYTNLEIYQILNKVYGKILSEFPKISNVSNKQYETISKYVSANSDGKCKIGWSKIKTKKGKLDTVKKYISECDDTPRITLLQILEFGKANLYKETVQMIDEIKLLKSSLNEIETTLDKSVYAHKNAKDQITKIISQWITGEMSGYCFGFEGSPGVGKTSLAKLGLANCLKDEFGKSRPFAFIAMGGSSNGATLEGHGYTYVNSSWGKIAQIVMDSECLNPIIYIDEFDKESKSEQGKEITGILTHLLDSSQNDEFEDKYFGIKLNLSKALIIVSYNDPNQIDKVLLDRIHRVKFDNLTLEDKLTIARDYIIPEIERKMGFDNTVLITDEILSEIINLYTSEPGVRKFKEILFDLYGAINVELLKCEDLTRELPIQITSEELESKYLNQYMKIEEDEIYETDRIGTICGMWANTAGKGGILQIETAYFPSTTFLDLKLTGLQGDVMKESMNVAKSLAWSMCSDDVKHKLIAMFNESKCQGLHIHCPKGAVSKDGPSAGIAITIAIFSLFNNLLIRRDIAITGEVDLFGNASSIGGLEHKISGSIRAGIKKIMYPSGNSKDFVELSKRIKLPDTVTFVEFSHIKDIFKHVFI